MTGEVMRFKEGVENPFDYFVWVDGQCRVINSIYLLRNLEMLEEIYGHLWSARQTGLFGECDCKSGNGRRNNEKAAQRRKVPKNKNEVILAFGQEGLEKLIEWGYIPCPSCTPEANKFFYGQALAAICNVYGFADPTYFANKNVLGYDARRIKWEEILPIVGGTPNRIYLPKGLKLGELRDFRDRFLKIGFNLPPVGYMDRGAHGGFVEYMFD